MNLGTRLPESAELVASWIGSRHAWISTDHARDMIRADMRIIGPAIGTHTADGLALRSAIRIASRLFPDSVTWEEHWSKSSEQS